MKSGKKIMASPDVRSIRAIPWQEIKNSIENYLDNENTIISNLETGIAALELEIKAKKKATASQPMSNEQIQQIITATVSAEGSYGSVEKAKVTACGKPGKRPRVPSDSMEVAVDHVREVAQPFLSTGDVKSEKGTFIDVCKLFLEAGDDELENYCVHVCAELAGVVQGVSDQHSNSEKSTAKLEKELAKKNKEVLGAKTRLGQCTQSKMNIESFQNYLEDLDTEIGKRHEAVRKAERELDDATWALDDLEKQLLTQQKAVQDANDLAQAWAKELDTGKEKLKGLLKNEQELIEQIGEAKNLLSSLREELSKLMKASEAILEIKKYVSATALKMGYYVDIAVREPVREVGLVEETNVWDYFSKNAAEECDAGAPPFKKELSSFHQYCTQTALPQFEKVKSLIDLTPLCTLDTEDNIASDMDKAVQSRVSLLTHDLEDVQSWLQHFKGSKMTVEQEQEKVEAGEPEGLRQVITVYGATKLYTGYLKEWKLDRGIFQQLLDKLSQEMIVLQDDIVQEEALLNQTKTNLDAVSKARQEAQNQVNAASETLDTALVGKQEVEEILSALTAQIEEAKNLLTDLEEVLKQAILKYKEARALLVSGHTSGKGAVFSLSQAHEGMLRDA
jgi:DNA repair exonuclease SbcCD ATPase subunit